MKIKVYNKKAEKVSDSEISDKVFGLDVNESLIHQAYVRQISNERQILAHTKDRSEVRGGGAKPWAQKGTGRARHGSKRSPIWIGGGVTFGPSKDRNFSKNINKKMRQKALLMVVSDRVKDSAMLVMEDINMDEYKTKIFNEIVTSFEKKVIKLDEKKKRSILVINDKKDDKVKNSGRNLTGVKVINLDNINIVDLLKYRNLIITQECVKQLEERYVTKN
ncbi:50S ribosomal protein L4 [Candidatus Parcubacteria bacterium]|nr:50S ribosomal protein L4 [Candidatus Parcubacteria bacterium]